MRNSANSAINRTYVVVMRSPEQDETSPPSPFVSVGSRPDAAVSIYGAGLPARISGVLHISSANTDTNELFIRNDSAVFASLFSIIDEMKGLPAEFSESVDDETAFDAERVLAFIESTGVPPPKIFSHGGDAVVFTWDFDKISRYLTISGGDAAFLDVNKTTYVQCPYEITPLDGPHAASWLRMLGVSKAVKNAVE